MLSYRRIAVLCTGWFYAAADAFIGILSRVHTETFRFADYAITTFVAWMLAPFAPPPSLDANDTREPIATISAPGARTCRTANLSERDRAGLSLGAEQHRMSLCM